MLSMELAHVLTTTTAGSSSRAKPASVFCESFVSVLGLADYSVSTAVIERHCSRVKVAEDNI